MKVVIKDGYVRLDGRKDELIAGLACYVLTLMEEDTSFEDIMWACNKAKKEYENNNKSRINAIHEDKDFSIHEINVEGMTKKDIKNFILKELLGGN